MHTPRAALLVAVSLSACSDASAPAGGVELTPAPATAQVAHEAAGPTKPGDALDDALGALLSYLRAHRGVLLPETRPELVAAIDRVVATASRASGADELVRASSRTAEGHERILQLTKDAALERVVDGIIIADGTVQIEAAERTLIVATDAAYLTECRGCVVLAGRLVVVTDAAPAGDGTRALLWSAGALILDDVSGTVVAGPDARTHARSRGVIVVDEKALPRTEAPPAPVAPALAVVAIEKPENAPVTVVLRGAAGTKDQRITIGRAVAVVDEEPWRLAQVFGAHVALRRGDDVAFLTKAE